AALRFHGGDEIVLDVPAAFQLRRYFHFMQSAIAGATRVHGVGAEVVSHRAGFTVDFETVAACECVDAAELEDAFGAVGKFAQDRDQIRNDDFVPLPDGVQDFSARVNAGDIAEPALKHFDVDAEGEHVEAADLDPL